MKLKRLKIKDQIFLFMMLIVLCATIFLGTIVYNVSKYIIERNYREAYTHNLQVSSNITDLQLENLINLSRTLLNDKNLVEVLIKERNTAKEQGGTMFNTGDQQTIARILGEVAGQDQLIEGMSIISVNGKSCFYYKRIRSGNFSHYYSDASILNEEWLSQLQTTEGREQFYAYDVLAPQMPEYISLTKKLINPSTQEEMGYLVVCIRDSLFDKAFGRNGEKYTTGLCMVIDKNGERPLVYYNGDEHDQDNILDAYLESPQETGRYLFTSSTNSLTGWELINVVEKDDLAKDSFYIGGIIMIAIAVLALFSIYISRMISRRMLKPLGRLETVIEAVGEGDRHIEEAFDESEIGKIGTKFKEMVNNNLELSDRLLSSELKEKEAELLLLQAQINPHFLYNTLDSLYCMAVIDHNDNIANMVSSLSNTFKLSLNRGQRYIQVNDEINHIKEYMAIQNIRYNNRFDLILDVEEAIKPLTMIKFILQPFVENAMYHGLEAKIGRGYIKVSGHAAKDGILMFCIEDNGVGMADISVVMRGYGVKNVVERIHLYYGEEYGVTFESWPGQGTKVTIRIPVSSVGRIDR